MKRIMVMKKRGAAPLLISLWIVKYELLYSYFYVVWICTFVPVQITFHVYCPRSISGYHAFCFFLLTKSVPAYIPIRIQITTRVPMRAFEVAGSGPRSTLPPPAPLMESSL